MHAVIHGRVGDANGFEFPERVAHGFFHERIFPLHVLAVESVGGGEHVGDEHRCRGTGPERGAPLEARDEARTGKELAPEEVRRFGVRIAAQKENVAGIGKELGMLHLEGSQIRLRQHVTRFAAQGGPVGMGAEHHGVHAFTGVGELLHFLLDLHLNGAELHLLLPVQLARSLRVLADLLAHFLLQVEVECRRPPDGHFVQEPVHGRFAPAGAQLLQLLHDVVADHAHAIRFPDCVFRRHYDEFLSPRLRRFARGFHFLGRVVHVDHEQDVLRESGGREQQGEEEREVSHFTILASVRRRARSRSGIFGYFALSEVRS